MNTKALKQKILDLAIHGKLLPLEKVEQIRKEEPASKLLEKIRAEKQEKIAKGELKKDKNDSFIFVGDDKRHYEKFADGSVKDIEDEIPFDVPDGWAVARMGTYITFTGGAQPPKETFEYSPNENNIRLIQIRDYKTNDFVTYIPKNLARRFCSKTDVMIGRYGPPLFQILRGIEGAYNVALMKAEAIPEIMQNNYLYYMLQDRTLLHFLESLSDRTCGQDGVNMFELNNYLILIPPYEEQTIIIKKLEETFPLINTLAENINDLNVSIKQAKSKILDLAIHGKLTPQDPNDESASVLLEKIRAEKEAKIANGELKRDKNDSYIYKGSDNCHYQKNADGSIANIEDEIPFEVPEGWSWVRLSLLGEYKKGPFGSALTKSMFVPKAETTIKVYEQKNAIHKNSSLGDYYISKEYFETKMKSFEVFPGDIIVSCAGTIGETYILPKNIERGIINQALMRMKITDKINIGYFLMFFDHILKDESAKSGKGTAIKNIPPFDVFKQFLFPLPPLTEQTRIVAKIEELFTLLDNIQNNLI